MVYLLAGQTKLLLRIGSITEVANISSKKLTRVNGEIKVPEVLLIDQEGSKIGVVKTYVAIERAQAASLDLVEISPNSEPPVCRIMDYGKYRFEQSKKTSAQRKKQKRVQIKEIKFRPATDIGDYNVKVNKAIKFLQSGDKVKVTLRFRGRELAHHELGLNLLRRVEHDLEQYGIIEQRPKFEGPQVVMLVGPK